MFRELLSTEFRAYGSLSNTQLDQLASHYEALTRWNERLNLTRIRDLGDSVRFHYCESLFLARSLPLGSHPIVDVGSGGGFPGIPVAVFRPDCEVTLVESHQRKAVFLKEASRKQSNVRVLAKRAEDVAETFDWVISRAVSYADLGRFLKELAPNADLLSGAEAPPERLGFAWAMPVPLPWGNQRFLWTGRALSVSE